MEKNLVCESLEQTAIQMASILESGKVLKMITQGLVNVTGPSCALVWETQPGGRCSDCDMPAHCLNHDRVPGKHRSG